MLVIVGCVHCLHVDKLEEVVETRAASDRTKKRGEFLFECRETVKERGTEYLKNYSHSKPKKYTNAEALKLHGYCDNLHTLINVYQGIRYADGIVENASEAGNELYAGTAYSVVLLLLRDNLDDFWPFKVVDGENWKEGNLN